ncbi:BQ2448_2962 [Microbotryum intermedium]|uniref:BQ2448_2962 protein n=1 Tax=Microbotryum intermedium TaxID=269621 RepID=A0A238FHK9_9BASI|nr:BQ2448_2962 [Microbotryum intermedium]
MAMRRNDTVDVDRRPDSYFGSVSERNDCRPTLAHVVVAMEWTNQVQPKLSKQRAKPNPPSKLRQLLENLELIAHERPTPCHALGFAISANLAYFVILDHHAAHVAEIDDC